MTAPIAPPHPATPYPPAAADHAAFRALRSFASLDGLRALSILAVIFHHAHGSIDLGRFGRRGFLGVDMFFVLSGFLIVTLLLRERERHAGLSLGSFYARRALRIMPVYYGLLIGLALVFSTIARSGQSGAAFLRELPYHLTYTSNWVVTTSMMSITWSLAAEWQFYLLWPPIEKLMRRPLIALAVLLGLSQLLYFGVLDGLLWSWFRQGPSELAMLRKTTFTPILLGVLLAHLLHDARGFSWLARVCGRRYSALVLALGLVLCLVALPENVRGWPQLVIHLLLMLLLASAVLRTDHSLVPLRQWAPRRRIGALSYGMYLLHVLAMYAATAICARAQLSTALLFPITVALTFVLAELSHRFYETRFLRLKEHYSR
jgi:peptidoglycan/LPS O-acetylase OafA/YrhL